MPKPLPIPPEAAECLRLWLKKARTKPQYERVLCCWLRVAFKMHSRQIGQILDWAPDAVRNVQRRYLHEGEAAFKGPGRGGRHHQHLTKEAEREFLTGLLEETRPQVILDTRVIQQAYEKRVGHPVADTVIYRLLKRWRWRREAKGTVTAPPWAPAGIPESSGAAEEVPEARPARL